MKTKGKDLIKDVLESWEFPIIAENDSSVLFRYQMGYVEAKQYSDDESDAISLILKGAFKAENDIAEAGAIRTCNQLNQDIFHSKLYLDKDNFLEIASEFFYRPGDNIEYLLLMSLKTLIMGRKRFFEDYRAIEEGANFLTNLEISKFFGEN